MSTYVEAGPFRVYMTLTGYVVKDERTQENVSSPSCSYETALRIAELNATTDPEYADVDEDGQLALGVTGDQRAIPGLARPRQED